MAVGGSSLGVAGGGVVARALSDTKLHIVDCDVSWIDCWWLVGSLDTGAVSWSKISGSAVEECVMGRVSSLIQLTFKTMDGNARRVVLFSA